MASAPNCSRVGSINASYSGSFEFKSRLRYSLPCRCRQVSALCSHMRPLSSVGKEIRPRTVGQYTRVRLSAGEGNSVLSIRRVRTNCSIVPWVRGLSIHLPPPFDWFLSLSLWLLHSCCVHALCFTHCQGNVDHSLPFRVEVKNAWSYISVDPYAYLASQFNRVVSAAASNSGYIP
jgi:hypothetical protein